MRDCWKCGGDGYLPQYAHIEKGKCYPCDGTGKLTEAQDKKYTLEAFEKGTKRGGRTTHLFSVNPKYLDRKQLEKFRTRIKTRASELGLKLKAGFTTETALKKLQEAYEGEHGAVENGTRVKPADKKAGEKPKAEPKAEPKKVEPKKEEPKKEEPKKEGRGYKIVNRLSDLDPNHRRVKRVNQLKKQGVTKLPFDFSSLHEYLFDTYSKEIADGVTKDMEAIVGRVEEDYAGLIGNVTFEELSIFTTPTDFLGQYRIRPSDSRYGLDLAIDEFVNIHIEKVMLSNIMGDDFWAIKRREEGNRIKETLVHELAHAFHHQVLYNHDHDAFRNVVKGVNPKADLIINKYEAKMQELVKATGFTRAQVTRLFSGEVVSSVEQQKEVTSKFFRLYGAYNAKEYLAVMSQKLATKAGRRILENDFPDDYSMLKEIYEGVLDL